MFLVILAQSAATSRAYAVKCRVDEAKSHTRSAQLTTAVVVVIVPLFLTKPLQYLPNAVLSSGVFLIGLKLIDIANMKGIRRLRKDEFACPRRERSPSQDW
jgi:MFS superfamily sulfate permease-like transporter